MNNPYIYVTGASGFIGSKLTTKLKKNRIPHYSISRKKLGARNSILLRNYKDFFPKQKSHLVHLAENNNEDLIRSFGNSFITINKKNINSLIKKNWEHIVYLSSALVYDFESPKYGNGDNLDIIKPNSIYQKSKIECEKIILDNGGTVLRMTNIYGPGMSANNIFSDIFKQLEGDGPIILRSLKASRDFLWIDDAVQAILVASKKKKNGIYNIASGKTTCISRLLEIILTIENKSHREIIEKNSTIHTSKVKLNIEKTKKELGWKPVTLLETGIKKLLSNNKANEK